MSTEDKRALLGHFLAALAYRTQKALRDAPANFGLFRMEDGVRTPAELVRHMTSVLGYARTHFIGGHYWPEPLSSFDEEVIRFHEMLGTLAQHLRNGDVLLDGMTEERLLQGPFADAMTHAGQLAMLRRLAGSPVPPEDFSLAAVDAANVGPGQPPPASPDAEWPEAPSHHDDLQPRRSAMRQVSLAEVPEELGTGFAAAGARGRATEEERANAESLQRMLRAIASGSYDELRELLAPDVTLEIAAPRRFPWIRRAAGADAVVEAIAHNFSTVRDQMPHPLARSEEHTSELQ